jgi:dihydrofolate reductase
MEPYDHPQLKVIREDPAALVKQLKQQPGKPIYLCGGGKLARTLLDAQLIDEVILKINPVLYGAGIPLFSEGDMVIPLKLENIKVYDNGALFVTYALKYDAL